MEKRDYLFLYTTQWNTPNGDPFTGEQRYDPATRKIMVSDVRIKRFIRDKMIEILADVDPVFVQFDALKVKDIDKMSGAALAFRQFLLKQKLISKINDDLGMKRNEAERMFRQFIDVRLFGGLVTIKDNSNLSVEGAVQFKILSSSLNRVKLETIQNTTVFPSDVKKNTQGSIGTSSIVPFSIIPITGWLNEESGRLNKLTENDIYKMLSLLWLGVRDKNSRSKTSQKPVVLFEIVYEGLPYKFNPAKKVYRKINDLHRLVTLESKIPEENIRSEEDYALDFTLLIDEVNKGQVASVRYFTEDEKLKEELAKNKKFKFNEILIEISEKEEEVVNEQNS